MVPRSWILQTVAIRRLFLLQHRQDNIFGFEVNVSTASGWAVWKTQSARQINCSQRQFVPFEVIFTTLMYVQVCAWARTWYYGFTSAVWGACFQDILASFCTVGGSEDALSVLIHAIFNGLFCLEYVLLDNQFLVPNLYFFRDIFHFHAWKMKSIQRLPPDRLHVKTEMPL